ncbi:hypothetical protein E6C27_scaffold55G001270 [Cucumis melo var. makuwa]|uniref:Ty3-gypsy retrotransposon protein n=1 Tax=Cucumis melo var. makuwa TaxID=1194695 RepID=A0A5A7UAD5_CUCMM|nr:hypothetical protein E6C27_scaffold55G001270 [Cucumis melo var. makuwa]
MPRDSYARRARVCQPKLITPLRSKAEKPKFVASLRSEAEQPSRVASLRSGAKQSKPRLPTSRARLADVHASIRRSAAEASVCSRRRAKPWCSRTTRNRRTTRIRKSAPRCAKSRPGRSSRSATRNRRVPRPEARPALHASDPEPAPRAPVTSLLGKHTCLAVRTRQVNLQYDAIDDIVTLWHDIVMTRTVVTPIRVIPAWVSFGITTYLGLCGPTGHQSSMDIDMTRVTRRGPRIPIVLGVPRDIEDQSYVPMGAHVARVRECARDWVEDEVRAKASWRATRSDRGEP